MGRASINSSNRKKIAGICLLVFVVAFAAYANTLKNDFIWDDEYLILNNSQIKSFTHLPNVFKTYVGYGSENINNFYRPVQEISNMIDYFLWGEYPAGFHFTNTVLHALVSVMVFVFLFYLTGNAMASCIASLLYGVHPVHSEAIAYIAGRADSLYAFFMLLSLVFFIRFANRARSGRSDPLKYYLSIAFFILSLLSKEIIITMPLLIFLYMFYFLKGDGEADKVYEKLKWSWIPYAAIVVVYAALRLTVLSFADIAPPSAFGKIPLFLRLVTFFRTVGIYFKLMIFPVDLHMERTIAISRNIFNLQALLAIAMIGIIIWAAYKTYKINKFVSFSIVWFFANLLPVSNIIPINSFLAEHWIYMASVGPFLLIGLGLTWVYNKIFVKRKILQITFFVALAVIIGVYFRLTVIRNTDWRDEISFFHSTLKYHPRNARLYLNLGNTYYEKGEVDNAIEQYRKATEINKDYAVAYGNIGSAYLHKKNIDEAEKYLEKAIGLKQNYPIAHYNLGIVYFKRGRYKDAIKELETATEQLPQLYQAWNMLGRTYLKVGDRRKAREAFGRSLKIMPGQDKVRRVLEKLQ
ncbi:MAG: tetratricopeptide repeat protein [Candidatus Omnitrophota bacterium]|jgi:tetratricopeptide (TPR) repeat protein